MSERSIDEASGELVESAARLGLELTSRQVEQFEIYCRMILDTNQHFNLTALRSPAQVMHTLFLDSLTIAPVLPPGLKMADSPARAVDVGTGAGVPGVPLKILFPQWSLLLIESNGKKARFVRAVVEALGLADVTVECSRAEEIGTLHQYRDAADLCVARAVSALPSLLELCAPLVKKGGLLVFPKSGDLPAEIQSAEPAARALRVRFRTQSLVPTRLGLGENRAIAVYTKVGATPVEYPRRIGLATSRPIGRQPIAES